MALVTFDGYETMGPNGTNPDDDVLNRRYYGSDLLDVRVIPSIGGGLGFSQYDAASQFAFYAGKRGGPYNTDTTKFWGLRWKQVNYLSSTYYMMRWVTDTSSWACGLKVFTDGSLVLYDHAYDAIAISDPGVMRIRQWNRIEIKIYYHATSGTFELWANGKQIFNETGIDTAGTTGTYHKDFRAYSDTSLVPIAPRWDDYYCCDTSGNTHNDFIGHFTTLARYPTGDDTADWTPSTGNDNYAMVDETEPNDDTDYVEASDAGDTDLYTSGNLSDVTSVLAVVLGADYRIDAPGSKELRQVLDSGGTEYAGETLTVNSTDYAYHYDLWEEDPDTSAAWTINGYNTTKLGLEVIS